MGLINKNPHTEQLEINDYVDRSRRMQRNDLENIPALLACGLLFVVAGPAYLLAIILMYGFVSVRLAHTIAVLSDNIQAYFHVLNTTQFGP